MRKKQSFMSIVSIMSIFLINAGMNTINPAIQKIVEAFPNLTFTTILLVSTLPSLFAVPSALISGMLAGSKIRYKTLAVLGVLLFIIGGIAPAFADNFTIILIERSIFGIALGIITPLGNTFILTSFVDQQRASLLGFSNVMINIGGVILQSLGGYLAVFGWNYSFYGHALAIVTLLLIIFFLPEPEKAAQSENSSESKTKIPASLWFLYIIYGASIILMHPMMVNMSSLLAINGFGDSAAAGVVLSSFTIGGMLGGLLFSKVYKYTKRYIVAIGLFIFAIGMAGLIYGGNIVVVTISMALVGFANFNLLPTIVMIIGMKVSDKAIAISMSILMATINLAVFISTYYIGLIGKITGDAIVNPILIGMIIYMLAALIFLFINPFPKLSEKLPEIEN